MPLCLSEFVRVRVGLRFFSGDFELSCQLTQWSLLASVPPAVQTGVMRADRRGQFYAGRCLVPYSHRAWRALAQGQHRKLREHSHMLVDDSE